MWQAWVEGGCWWRGGEQEAQCAPFVQALKDFITADSECTLPCWESDSAKHTKCLHVVPTKIDWQEIPECEVLEAMEKLTLLYKSVYEQRPLINATKLERATRSARLGVWDWEVLKQKIYENLYDQDLRGLGDYVVELTTDTTKASRQLLRQKGGGANGTLKKWWQR